MSDTTALVAAVTSRYAAWDPPSWPDPWPEREPEDAAYSRLTDPLRYEILFRRADAWLAELEHVPGVTVEVLADPGASVRAGHPLARGRRVTCDRPGALPLLVLERDDPMPVVAFALGEPQVVLEEQPDCGCDACDSGSEGLLRVVDQLFVEVLTSPVVVLQDAEGRWDARWSHHTAQAGGHPDVPRPFEELMADCRRIAAGEAVDLPPGTRVWVSQPWLGAPSGQGVSPAR